jgi:hypothetical protein
MLRPADYTFDSAPYVVYANMLGDSTIESAMESDAREFRASDPQLKITDRAGVTSKSGEKFKLREFRSAKLRQQGYEAIAYLPRGKHVLLFVFSAQSEAQYAAGFPVFQQLLSTYSSSAPKVTLGK